MWDSNEVSTELLFNRQMPRIRRLRLEVLDGPDTGKAAELDTDPIRIGTAPGCELRLTDATVSGMHVELSREKDGVLIRDLGSTNRTLAGDLELRALVVTHPLVLRLGKSEVRVTPLSTQSPIEVSKEGRFGDLVGSSVAIRAVFAKLNRVAASDVTVLITGETGTGKELTAQAIRDRSPRRDGPFVVVDCGALPANLIESELFGHERGAFTGADRAHAGTFERASGGTIFLDEIGELPLSLQPALLGILERREARRVGGGAPIAVDVRIIAATNKDLSQEVSRGAFRADLYYRLACVEVRLPPLRDRPDDIPALLDVFLAELSGAPTTFSPEAIERLKRYPWPGNIRELRNLIERSVLLREDPDPGAAKAPAPVVVRDLDLDYDRPFKDLKNELIANFERQYVGRLLAGTGGNITAAARKAHIDRVYLYKLMDRYQLEPPAKG